MKNRTLVTIIADYGDLSDLAFAEVRQRLYEILNDDDFVIETVAVPAFDTVATGFVVGQLGMNSKLGERHKFYVNTAPRKDDPNPRARNAGEGLAYAKLKNGVEIVAVHSGYSLSFVRDEAAIIKTLQVSSEGSQFRSRDVFPPAFGKIAHGDHSGMGEDARDTVPDMPKSVVCYTDGYGNLKTTVDASILPALKDQTINVTINGKTVPVRAAEGIFGVKDGEFCISTGSSGWPDKQGHANRFVEIVCRGGNAAKAFDFPQGGAKVEWTKAS